MEMGHESTALSTEVDEFVAQQIGFQTADAIAANTLYLVECLHQINELLACGLSEITDIHTRQHNLFTALERCLLSLSHQRRYAGIATEPTGIGNGAVGAEIVTTILHLQEIARAIASRTTGCKTTDVLRLLRHIGSCCTAMDKSIGEKLNEVCLLVGSQHQIDTLYLAHLLRLQLGIASRHHHKSTRMLAHHAMNGLTTLMVSHLGHRTSINQTNVSLFALGCRQHPQLLKHLCKGRCLREVQFAAQSEICCFFPLKN